MNENFYLSVFNTKNKAVFLNSILETRGYKVFQLVSTPCAIKVGCNYAIKFKDERYMDIINDEATKLGIGNPDIYFAQKYNGRYNYKKISV